LYSPETSGAILHRLHIDRATDVQIAMNEAGDEGFDSACSAFFFLS
jgi:hypothetical protein